MAWHNGKGGKTLVGPDTDNQPLFLAWRQVVMTPVAGSTETSTR